jgi:hypothetical protein
MAKANLKEQLIRIPATQYAKLLVVDPSILDGNGNVRYGSINKLFNSLLNQHIEKQEIQILTHFAQMPRVSHE